MSVARINHASVVMADGKVLVAGGGIGLTSAEIYDPDLNSWSNAAAMNHGH